MKIVKQFKNIILYIFIFLFICSPVSASTLILKSTENEYFKNSTFGVEVAINEVELCVNAVQARLRFDKKDIEVVDFLTGSSIMNLWLDQPDKDTIALANQVGELSFSGGIPGGYCGKIPGDPGDSNTVGKIIFKVNEISGSKKTNINFSEAVVLLNDGLGSADQIKTKGIELNLINQENDDSNEYKAELELDGIKPEPFVIQLRRDDNLFNGQYYIIFSTTDKQTGIDRFEILEIRSGEQIGEDGKISLLDRLMGQKREKVSWEVAKTPQLLRDQTLESTIKVRAIDKSGNERQASIIPPEGEREKIRNASYKSLFMVLLTIGIILILIIVLILLIRKKSHAKKNKEDQFFEE